MSFLAAFNSDGAPVDEEFVRFWRARKMLAERAGPSGELVLICASPGLVREETNQRHLIERAGGSRLLGRVRLDRRDELCAQLAAPDAESDARLCLRAYARWGERCTEHLRGDFSFVVWDDARRRLFCARDQIGVRPLFYARKRDSWFVGDSLDIVARSSGLTTDLDDVWIADFLVRPFCLDFDRTVYEHVKRLPPAHALSLSRGCVALKKYWGLELGEPILYRRKEQYLEHFHAVLARAVKDRLPPGRLGVSMSGGLDSTTLAAKAVEVAGDASRVVAYTSFFERLLPDEESHFSALVAKRLRISHLLQPIDDAYDRQAEEPYMLTDEPGGPSAAAAIRRKVETEMASQASVWFYGEGPDNALTFEWRAYLRWLLMRRDWSGFLNAVASYLRGKQLREWRLTFEKLAHYRREAEPVSRTRLPPWINKDLAQRVDFVARDRNSTSIRSDFAQSWRPGALASFTSPIWQRFLEHLDPVISGAPLDYRHPYLDLDVLIFMLRTPPIPWGRRKFLIREAMRGVLPDEALSRDKTPLLIDPQARVARKTPRPPLSADPRLAKYVDVAALPIQSISASEDPLAKVRILDAWLKARAQ